MDRQETNKHWFLPNNGNMALWLNLLFMLFGILVLGWHPEFILIAYFMETIIIGVLNIGKMATVQLVGEAERRERATRTARNARSQANIPFFILHYFFFVFVQSVFMFAFCGKQFPEIPEAFHVLKNYRWVLSQPDILPPILGLAATNSINQIYHYYIPQKYHKYTLAETMTQPYLRIFIQQFVVILSGFFMFFSQAMVAAIILVMLRFVLDMFLFMATKKPIFKEKLLNRLTQNESNEEEATKQRSQLNSFFED